MSNYTKKIFYHDVNTPYSDLVDLLHNAFKERLDSNLNFGCATFSLEELKEHTKDSYIVCFFDEGKPIAMAVLSEKNMFMVRYGAFEFLAVSPIKKYRGRGLGVQIERECISLANNLGMELVTLSTAVEAVSSVKTHIKVGCKIYRVKHYAGRNYLSYCFYYPLKKSFLNFILFSSFAS